MSEQKPSRLEYRVEYRVVQHYLISEFVDRVNKLLEAGWDLVGGVSSAAHYNGTETYCQAMSRPKGQVTP